MIRAPQLCQNHKAVPKAEKQRWKNFKKLWNFLSNVAFLVYQQRKQESLAFGGGSPK